ncbi:unnamed protein product [Auanema sp. JU1783]|nr:unnamed protein product [Auanema sp. JU1783]
MNVLPILLAILVAIHSAAADDDCQDDVYQGCQDKLNAALGLSDPQPWHSPESFRYQIESQYENSPLDGTRKVCKAFREFKVCMGDQYQKCINPLHFVLSSVTPYSAFQFVSTFNTLQYTCGAGFQTMLRQYNCMKNAWNTANSQQLNACRTVFERRSNDIPESACSFASTYLDCWENHFRDVCGKGTEDAQFWACEYSRINVFTRFPQCSTKCVLPYYGGIIG